MWDTLSRNEQRYIATTAAGSRQQSRFIALMEDYERTMELVNIAQDSAGRSSIQFAKYQDTMEFKINKLKNAWESLRINVLDEKVYKKIIDMATKVVKTFEGKDPFLQWIPSVVLLAQTVSKTIRAMVLDVQTGGVNLSKGFALAFTNSGTKTEQIENEVKINTLQEQELEIKQRINDTDELRKSSQKELLDLERENEILLEEEQEMNAPLKERVKEIEKEKNATQENINKLKEQQKERTKEKEAIAQEIQETKDLLRQKEKEIGNSEVGIAMREKELQSRTSTPKGARRTEEVIKQDIVNYEVQGSKALKEASVLEEQLVQQQVEQQKASQNLERTNSELNEQNILIEQQSSELSELDGKIEQNTQERQQNERLIAHEKSTLQGYTSTLEKEKQELLENEVATASLKRTQEEFNASIVRRQIVFQTLGTTISSLTSSLIMGIDLEQSMMNVVIFSVPQLLTSVFSATAAWWGYRQAVDEATKAQLLQQKTQSATTALVLLIVSALALLVKYIVKNYKEGQKLKEETSKLSTEYGKAEKQIQEYVSQLETLTEKLDETRDAAKELRDNLTSLTENRDIVAEYQTKGFHTSDEEAAYQNSLNFFKENNPEFLQEKNGVLSINLNELNKAILETQERQKEIQAEELELTQKEYLLRKDMNESEKVAAEKRKEIADNIIKGQINTDEEYAVNKLFETLKNSKDRFYASGFKAFTAEQKGYVAPFLKELLKNQGMDVETGATFDDMASMLVAGKTATEAELTVIQNIAKNLEDFSKTQQAQINTLIYENNQLNRKIQENVLTDEQKSAIREKTGLTESDESWKYQIYASKDFKGEDILSILSLLAGTDQNFSRYSTDVEEFNKGQEYLDEISEYFGGISNIENHLGTGTYFEALQSIIKEWELNGDTEKLDKLLKGLKESDIYSDFSSDIFSSVIEGIDTLLEDTGHDIHQTVEQMGKDLEDYKEIIKNSYSYEYEQEEFAKRYGGKEADYGPSFLPDENALKTFGARLESYSENAAKSILNGFKTSFKNETSEQRGLLAGMDFSSINALNKDTTLRNYATQLMETGKSYEDAQNAVEKLFNIYNNAGVLDLTTEIGDVQAFVQKTNDFNELLVENADSLKPFLDGGKEMKLTSKQFTDLSKLLEKKLGISPDLYIDTTSGTAILDSSALTEFVDNYSKNANEALKNVIQNLQDKANEIKAAKQAIEENLVIGSNNKTLKDIFELYNKNGKEIPKGLVEKIQKTTGISDLSIFEDKKTGKYITDLETIDSLYSGIINQIELTTKEAQKMAVGFKLNKVIDQLNDISDLISSIQSVAKNSIENGYLDYSDLTKLQEQFENSRFIKGLSIENYLSDKGQLDYKKLYGDVEAKLRAMIISDEYTKMTKTEQLEVQALLRTLKEQETELENITTKEKELDDAIKEANEKVDDAKEKVKDAEKKITDVQDKINDKLKEIAENEDKVIDAQNELNEAIYGSDDRKNALDALYNYDELLKKLERDANRAKEALDDLQYGDDTSQTIQNYADTQRQLLVGQKAQAEAQLRQYNALIDSLYRAPQVLNDINAKMGTDLSTNINDYVYQYDGIFMLNEDVLSAQTLPDTFKNTIASIVSEINSSAEKYESTLDSIRQNTKAFEDQMKKLRQDSLKNIADQQKSIAEQMKKEAEEEVKTTEDKYKAIKEADDDYIKALEDAIKKQQDLRKQERDWEELATKEKKLSLLQRDTSGSRAQETMQLEEDIQASRESLLDTSIQNIIDEMKELYELQAENRELEIEYQNELLDSTNYLQKAKEFIDNASSGELADWLTQQALKDYEELGGITDEVLEQLAFEGQETADSIKQSQEILNTNTQELLENALNITTDDVNNTQAQIADTIISSAQYTLDNTEKEIEDAIEKGRDALTDALETLEKSRQDYQDLQQDYIDAQQDLAKASADLAETYEDLAKAEAERSRFYALQSEAILNTKTSIDQAKDTALGDLEAIYDSLIDKYNEAKGQAIVNEGAGNVEESNKYENTANSYSHGIDDIARQIDNLGGDLSKRKTKQFATGGLVNYTGPAWVDGTPSKPEAFLNSEDTARIGAAAKLLSQIPLFKGRNITDNSISSSIGDTTIEVHINVENISSELDIDNALERVRQDILNVASPKGSSVILSK